MKILVVASTHYQQLFNQKFPNLTVFTTPSPHFFTGNWQEINLIFDFETNDLEQNLRFYNQYVHLNVLINSPLKQLASIAPHPTHFALGGFNGLPAFWENSVMELSVMRDTDKEILDKTLSHFTKDYAWVTDRVGMVTPRVIAMIINEAYYTLQEGTASRQDIDTGMKLGTNYPYGPFEWAKKIGLDHVYQILEAAYQDTHDERYRICPLLKTEMLLLQ
ncbi:3-hydroxybutyryl-CoA dehydrogenase [Flexibacter flexilis DSM 6793]|uniref:3-hydroxybutyryl-CoA dehydrogenase n=1 Tax=Flexibacter flexilis DSM 6793 TaxID=927664 RepID=A0A1I1JNP0_9BACT|nr:3-hydroxyacyl-CoA dehydrogenase family protein [Flexibacter flexilis]SFC49811.1 3-hydroxybutyryl-CoA dehydrogenase [Flexibacter flexilis DSM 6793]